MIRHLHPRLRAPVLIATVVGMDYAMCLAVVLRPPDVTGLPVWEGLWSIALGPVALLVAQLVALGGLLYLFIALRSVARGLARGSGDDQSGIHPFRAAALPVSLLLACTGGILAAARSWLDYPGLVVAIWIVPLLTVLAAARRSAPSDAVGGDVQRVVSRLRGASMLTAVAGGVFFIASGSLVAGGLLPLALLTDVPRHPPPTLAVASAVQDLGAGGGGGAAVRANLDLAAARRVGEAIHVLAFTGTSRQPDRLERSPVTRLPPWDSAGDRAAAHPANGAFDALSGATEADIVGTRWQPLEGLQLTAFELPVPRYADLWTGVRGRLAGASWLASAGDAPEARRRVRTVIDLGRLLARDGPLATDALIGLRIVEEGRTALADLSGAAPPAPLVPRIGSSAGARHVDEGKRLEWLRGYADLASSEGVSRGLRWDGFAHVQTFAPCASLHTTLWGPSPGTEAARRTFVERMAHHPQERALAELLSHGLLGTRAGTEGWGWLPRVLGLTLADRPAVSHCAPLAATLLMGG